MKYETQIILKKKFCCHHTLKNHNDEKKNVIIQKDQFLEKFLNGFFGKSNIFRKPVQIYEQ